MKQIVECIPNFSEARNSDVMDLIEEKIAQVNGIILANRHTDFDHNRTVLTFFGSPESVNEAAVLSAKLAQRYINLDHHTGEHPRIGALDVLPFVPMRDTPMEVCISLAHQVGKRIGTELQLPVYFYGEAAKLPERIALENIRRGEYEGLKKTIQVDPKKVPDEGPASLGTAGAIAIGARQPLIAFNVFLDTSDVTIAKTIAKKIRHSSGGFPAVKALGLCVSGKAQVSMNLTDYRLTNLPVVIEAIKKAAAQNDTKISHSELVGLIPQSAVLEALGDYLKLPILTPDMIIETHLR